MALDDDQLERIDALTAAKRIIMGGPATGFASNSGGPVLPSDRVAEVYIMARYIIVGINPTEPLFSLGKPEPAFPAPVDP